MNLHFSGCSFYINSDICNFRSFLRSLAIIWFHAAALGGIANVHLVNNKSSLILKPRSVITQLYGSWKSRKPLSRTIILSPLQPPYAGEICEMAPFGVIQIKNLNVQLCLYSLHRSDCTSKEVGVCTKISVQSIMALVIGYIFLKQVESHISVR